MIILVIVELYAKLIIKL